MTLSGQERRLYAELVSCIALDLANRHDWVEFVKSDKGIVEIRRLLDFGEGERFQHWFDGAQDACSVLWALGVAKGICDEFNGSPYRGKGMPIWFEMTMNVESVAQFVEKTLAPGHPSLTEVIAAFVDLGRMRDQISVERAVFVPNPDYFRVMDLFVVEGYAEKSGDGYRWTEKMRPSMEYLWVWDKNDPSPD